jgi:class 3 adenylate cyclase
MANTHSHTWHWSFDKPLADVWAVFADTARFNEASDFPRHQITEQVQPDGSVRYYAAGKLNGLPLEWEEIPTAWVEQQWFVHQRRFSKGPFRVFHVDVRMEATPAGCICHYTLTAEPANLLGRLMLATGFFRNISKKFAAMVAQTRGFLEGKESQPFRFPAPVLAGGASARCQQLCAQMRDSSFHHGLIDKLQHWVLERPDNEVWTMRPKVLARQWQVPELQVIELCLLAASRGVLNLRWDLLCPNCRISKASATRLDEIPRGTHCSSCNIDYGLNFNRNVELTFLPSKSLRQLDQGEYCLFAPMSTPHIRVQLRVEAGQGHVEAAGLPAGSYRVRTLEPGNDLLIESNGVDWPALLIDTHDELVMGPRPADTTGLVFDNQSKRGRTFIIEERSWMPEVLTAQEAATLQCFRELFDDNILRPGDHVEIDNVTMMFTDIKASTSLYERIGDASAFALVREHFAILAACVRKHNGAVVKTIGDAVMAVFNVPQDAVACSFAMQQAFAEFNASRGDHDEKVLIKLGLHTGPCIAITLNGILDYYGRVVNQAARLQELGQGNDIVLSQQLANEPAVQQLLAALPLEQGLASLKGIGETAWVRLLPMR